MTTHELRTQPVIDAMKDIVDEYGQNYRYEDRLKAIPDHTYGPGNCLYVVNGQPACLVGMVLDRLGVLEDVLAVINDDGENTTAHELVEALLDDEWEVDSKADAFLHEAQVAQDGGSTWAEAYQQALYNITGTFVEEEA